MRHTRMHFRWSVLCLGSVFFLLVVLAGCGGGTAASGSSVNTTSSAPMRSANQQNAAVPQDASVPGGAANASQGQQQKAASAGPQYLIKHLDVTMEFKDTRQVATDLQTWITSTDPRATSAGINYQQVGDNQYSITLSFSVEKDSYAKVQQYLGGYAFQHKGRLLSMKETVDDVTNTYVDTQSRLKNLRTEQARLQNLMSQAQALNDVLTIEQKLTNVEGEIESTEAQLNTLTSQVTFYPVTINLQPVGTTPPPPAPAPGWSVGQVFHDAFAASIAFAQGLATFLIWLLAFSVYILPVAVIGWFIRRWRNRPQHVAMPKAPPTTPFMHGYVTGEPPSPSPTGVAASNKPETMLSEDEA